MQITIDLIKKISYSMNALNYNVMDFLSIDWV